MNFWREMDEDLKIRIKAFLTITIGLPLALYLVSEGVFWIMNNYGKLNPYLVPFIVGFLWFFIWGILVFKKD